MNLDRIFLTDMDDKEIRPHLLRVHTPDGPMTNVLALTVTLDAAKSSGRVERITVIKRDAAGNLVRGKNGFETETFTR